MVAVEVRTLTTAEWELLRDVRFTSLRDAPEAFTSTVAREEHFPAEVWQLRTGTSAIAFVDGRPAGIVGWHRPEDAADTELVGMWVEPASRGTDVAASLVAHVVAATTGEPLVLHVLPTNERARALYRKAEFVDEDVDTIEGRPLIRMRHRGERPD